MEVASYPVELEEYISNNRSVGFFRTKSRGNRHKEAKSGIENGSQVE